MSPETQPYHPAKSFDPLHRLGEWVIEKMRMRREKADLASTQKQYVRSVLACGRGVEFCRFNDGHSYFKHDSNGNRIRQRHTINSKPHINK